MKRNLVVFVCLILWLAGSLTLSAQEQPVSVSGGFLKDSTRVGEEVGFFLAARYPQDKVILFPDTAFNFHPFEFTRKDYFSTKTKGGISYDSAVYYINTYEVDTAQWLQLPVFEVNVSDCTIFKSNADTIFLKEMIARLPDSLTSTLPVHATLAYQPVKYQFNYQLFIIIIGVLLIASAFTWFFFGNNINRYFKLRQLRKDYQIFAQHFSQQLEDVRKGFTVDSAAAPLTTWKRYMEKLNAMPYTKLTTRETLRLEKDESLGRSLQMIDRAIYGHDSDVISSLENLRAYAQQRFNKKVEEVKHG
jgi:hypothetical protein